MARLFVLERPSVIVPLRPTGCFDHPATITSSNLCLSVDEGVSIWPRHCGISRKESRMDTNSQVVPTLDHVIGQKTAVAVLRTAIDSYFYDRSKSSEEQAFPHLLVTGPSGTGKTLLSEIVAREVACNLHVELAQNLKTSEHAHGALMMLEPGDILFIMRFMSFLRPSPWRFTGHWKNESCSSVRSTSFHCHRSASSEQQRTNTCFTQAFVSVSAFRHG